MSIVIVMLAAGGSGKSTTSRAFGIGEPQTHVSKELITLRDGREEVRKMTYTLYENCGLSGGHRSGTDDNVSPVLVRMALYKCLENRDIAIVDGYMSSPQWIEAINDHPDVTEFIVLYIKLSYEELIRRIAQRLGLTVDELPQRRKERAAGNMKRPLSFMRNIEKLAKKPYRYIEVGDNHSPEDIVAELDDVICDIFQDCED